MVTLGRKNAARLLNIVGNKAWARREDHEDDGSHAVLARQKSLTPVDASPKRSSDVEAEPESSSDSDLPISSADIPPSFDHIGKSLAKRGLAPTIRRSGRLTCTDGTTDEPPRKILKTAEDEDFGIFGQSNSRKPKKSLSGAAGVFRAPAPRLQTYGRQKSENKMRMPDLSAFDTKPKASAAKFKTIPLPRPIPRNRNGDSSQGKDDPFKDAEELVELPERFDSDDTPQKSKSKGAKARNLPRSTKGSKKSKLELRKGPSIEDMSPRSSAPEFKKPGTFKARIDPEELDREMEEERQREAAQAATQIPDQGPCPMRCGKTLMRQQLETLDPKASIREQQVFCRRHRVKDAEEQWRRNGYPTIDWEKLPERLERHDKYIIRMIKHPHNLWFRKEMEKRNKRGKDRTIMQHLENEGLQGIGVGYYGPKGGDIMADYITKNYAAELRERAGSDKVMGNRGTTAYVHMVLVLELATLLIKRDMDVGDETARMIMNESNAVGDLLNPSEGGNTTSRRLGITVVDGEDEFDDTVFNDD
jgi:hypothetical protein